MKKLIGIAAVFATVILAASVFAVADNKVQGSITVQDRVCGLVTSGGPMEFGTLIAPTADLPLDNKTINVQNTGNTNIKDFKVEGTDWAGTVVSNTMPVGQTDVADGDVSCAEWDCHLTSVAQTIYDGDIKKQDILAVNFRLTVPQDQAADTYTQTITFTGGC